MPGLEEALLHVNWLSVGKTCLQVFVIFYVLVWIWRRIVGTQAERLVKGVFFLLAMCALSYVFGLSLITGFLQHLIPLAVMALLVVFQPEIRRGLGYLGRMDRFKLDFSLPNKGTENNQRNIDQIIGAVRKLSKNKTGALIVVEPPEGERDYLSPGTQVNADITTNLLLTIFFPKSPLHDGAVVIRQDKILAAGVILPMTGNPKLSHKYGTRHRAAVGLSEIYDGVCIVVSEETGMISAASRGMLVRYDNAEDLREPLSYIYSVNASEVAQTPAQQFLDKLGKKARVLDSETNNESNEASASNESGVLESSGTLNQPMPETSSQSPSTVDVTAAPTISEL